MNKLNLKDINIFYKAKLKIQKAIHPTIIKQMPSRRDFELKYINKEPKTEGPVLYLATHNNSHDAPVTCESIKDHSYILVGKQPLYLMDRIFFNINGKYDVDRDLKEDGQKVVNKIVKGLKSGVSTIIYPEKTWNTTPSNPINHCYWGWVDIAKQANVPVVPIALEYYELTDKVCYVNFGDPIYVNDSNYNKEELNNKLEETFTSLKYEIWEQFPVQKREDIDSNLWNKVMERRYNEYPKLNKDKEDTYVLKKGDSPDEVLNSEEFKLGVEKIEKSYGRSK